MVVHYRNEILNIELNNNAGLEYVRNVTYIANRVINSYLIGEHYDKATQGMLIKLNWYECIKDREEIDKISKMTWEYSSLKKEKTNFL